MSQYHYTQLSQKEREQIEEFLGLGLHPSEIANELGRNRSTIYRELNRNGIKNKNLRTRVNKPKNLNVDNRHFRGTIQVDINRKRKEDYRKRLREFEKNKAHYSAKKATQKARRRKSQAMARAHPLKLQPGYYLTNIVIGIGICGLVAITGLKSEFFMVYALAYSMHLTVNTFVRLKYFLNISEKNSVILGFLKGLVFVFLPSLGIQKSIFGTVHSPLMIAVMIATLFVSALMIKTEKKNYDALPMKRD